MKKKIIAITGGAGFIGSNLIKNLLSNTNYNIISLDNYFAGSTKNHVKNSRVKYFKGSCKNIDKYFSKYKKNIYALFHFGEFSRIYQSFKNLEQLCESNISGTSSVLNFCLKNRIRIIYSATSAAFGNSFKDQNLSPYSYTKTSNLNLILNYSKWFGLGFNIVYFYNVYGGLQILDHKMAAVIGIFENCKRKGIPLPIVKPGTQSRVFTHVDDIMIGCNKVLKNKKIKHLLIRAKESHSIINVAKMFNHKYKLIRMRPGERFVSSFPKKIRSDKVTVLFGKRRLSKYIKEKYESS